MGSTGASAIQTTLPASTVPRRQNDCRLTRLVLQAWNIAKKILHKLSCGLLFKNNPTPPATTNISSQNLPKVESPLNDPPVIKPVSKPALTPIQQNEKRFLKTHLVWNQFLCVVKSEDNSEPLEELIKKATETYGLQENSFRGDHPKAEKIRTLIATKYLKNQEFEKAMQIDGVLDTAIYLYSGHESSQIVPFFEALTKSGLWSEKILESFKALVFKHYLYHLDFKNILLTDPTCLQSRYTQVVAFSVKHRIPKIAELLNKRATGLWGAKWKQLQNYAPGNTEEDKRACFDALLFSSCTKYGAFEAADILFRERWNSLEGLIENEEFQKNFAELIRLGISFQSKMEFPYSESNFFQLLKGYFQVLSSENKKNLIYLFVISFKKLQFGKDAIEQFQDSPADKQVYYQQLLDSAIIRDLLGYTTFHEIMELAFPDPEAYEAVYYEKALGAGQLDPVIELLNKSYKDPSTTEKHPLHDKLFDACLKQECASPLIRFFKLKPAFNTDSEITRAFPIVLSTTGYLSPIDFIHNVCNGETQQELIMQLYTKMLDHAVQKKREPFEKSEFSRWTDIAAKELYWKRLEEHGLLAS